MGRSERFTPSSGLEPERDLWDVQIGRFKDKVRETCQREEGKIRVPAGDLRVRLCGMGNCTKPSMKDKIRVRSLCHRFASLWRWKRLLNSSAALNLDVHCSCCVKECDVTLLWTDLHNSCSWFNLSVKVSDQNNFHITEIRRIHLSNLQHRLFQTTSCEMFWNGSYRKTPESRWVPTMCSTELSRSYKSHKCSSHSVALCYSWIFSHWCFGEDSQTVPN